MPTPRPFRARAAIGAVQAADPSHHFVLEPMTANVIVGMLCVHLLCFSVMFWLISRRLHGKRMGMDVFALGNLMLGCAYVLQLLGGPAGWNAMSVVNHSLTLAAPIAYCLGAMRFFGVPVPVWRPLLGFVLAYGALQAGVQWVWGDVARYAMLSAGAAVLFLAMAATVVYGVRSFARDLYVEMVWFAVLISGICVLNVIKLQVLLTGGLQALALNQQFQLSFYVYMAFLATVLPPSMVWLVLRRLTDDLRSMAVRDPLTQLLNRRGLDEGLQAHFNSRAAGTAYLIAVDVDFFKCVNDRYGHQAGDVVLRRVAEVVQETVRRGDLVCRMGGEEFVVICVNADAQGVQLLAERIRQAVEVQSLDIGDAGGAIQCTITLGVSHGFGGLEGVDQALQQADEALYRGKAGGRNRVELALPESAAVSPLPALAPAQPQCEGVVEVR